MRNPLLRRAMGCTTLVLLSFPVFAVNYGLEFSGIQPEQVASGEISFGDESPAQLMTREECESQSEEDCAPAYLWFVQQEFYLKEGVQFRVTLRDRDGNVHTGTGIAGRTSIRVDVAPQASSDRRVGAADLPYPLNLALGLTGGAGELKLPSGSGGLGIRFTIGSPGSERFITLAPEDYEGESVGAWFRQVNDSVGKRLGFYASILNERFDAAASDTFPTGPEARGVAHQVENAPTGSTGLSFGPTVPIDTRVSNEVESWSAEFGGLLLPGDNGVSWSIGLRYRRTTQDLFNSMTTPTFPDIFANLNQEVRDEYLSVPVGWQRSWNVVGTVRPYMYLELAPGYSRSKLSGTYQFECNVCPAADQSLRQNIGDDDDAITWEGAAGVGVDVFLDRIAMGLYARYRYFDRVSFADNRESPLDDPPHLGEDDASGWIVGMNIGLRF